MDKRSHPLRADVRKQIKNKVWKSQRTQSKVFGAWGLIWG